MTLGCSQIPPIAFSYYWFLLCQYPRTFCSNQYPRPFRLTKQYSPPIRSSTMVMMVTMPVFSTTLPVTVSMARPITLLMRITKNPLLNLKFLMKATSYWIITSIQVENNYVLMDWRNWKNMPKNPNICMFESEKWQKWKEEVMMKPSSSAKFRLKLIGFPRKCMAGKLIPKLDLKTLFSFNANKLLFNNCPENVKKLVRSARKKQKRMGKLFWTEIKNDTNGKRIRQYGKEEGAAAKELLNEYTWKFLIIWMLTNLREGLSNQGLPHKAGIFQFKKNKDYENAIKWLNERIKFMVKVWFVDKFNEKKLIYEEGDLEAERNGIIEEYMKIYSAFFDEKIAEEMLEEEGWRMLMEKGKGKTPTVPAGNHEHDRHDDNLPHHNAAAEQHQQKQKYQDDREQHFHLHQQKQQLAPPHNPNQKIEEKGGFMPNIGHRLRSTTKIVSRLLSYYNPLSSHLFQGSQFT